MDTKHLKFISIIEAFAELEKYLGSGPLKGVGAKTAKKIIQHFGKKTLEIFAAEIERLTEINGIAQKKLESIRDA